MKRLAVCHGSCQCMLSMTTSRRRTDYLWFRSNTSQIWFSRAVPKEHIATEGRKQIQFSLKTTDRNEATALARRHASEQDARWGLLRQEPSAPPRPRIPTEEELEEAAVIAGYEWEVDAAEKSLRTLKGTGPLMWDSAREYAQRELDEQIRLTATGDYSNVESIVEQVIAATGFDLSTTDERYEELCDLLNRQLLNARKVNVERMAGNADYHSADKAVERVREKERQAAKSNGTISELFEKWAEDQLGQGEKRPDTVEQDRKIIQQFAAFVGEHRSIDSVSPQELAEYRDLLRDLPPKWQSHKVLSDLPIRKAAAEARTLGLRQTAHTTVNKHLSTISPLYKWLARDPRWAGMKNPCDGLFYRKVRGKNRRPSLSTVQLNQILRSPLFTGFRADGKEHQVGRQVADDWRKWILLLCMFTGARLGEIAQLRSCDVQLQRDVWLVHICEEEKSGLRTKNRKGHHVPLHSRLIELGFIDFVEARKAAGGDQATLFIGLERDSRGHFGKVSRWYRRYLEKLGLKEGRDGLGPHSLRHTLTDRLRSEAELLDGQIAVILDHSTTTTTGGYGALKQGTVKMMKDWIEGVTWDGVDFSPLHRTS